MCLLFGTTGFAESLEDQKARNVNDSIIVTINEEKVSPSSEDAESCFAYGLSLSEALRNCAPSEYGDCIKEFCAKNKNPIFEEISAIIRKNHSQEHAITLRVSDEFREKYERDYVISETTLLTVAPTYIALFTRHSDDGGDTGGGPGTRTVKGVCSAQYYGFVFGNEIFSLTVECTFNYNGQRAWYNSGFDYYYTIGSFTLWQVSNWRGWKEEAGTSYKAYCSGNFHFGLEYQGAGLVFQDFYCKNTLTCSKNGVLSYLREKQ